MLSLSDNNQTGIIETFNSTSRYLDDLFNIDNPYFEQMVSQIYPTELQLNKANSSDIEAPFFCPTAIKNHVIKYCTTVYERNGKKLFWSIKNSSEILNNRSLEVF